MEFEPVPMEEVPAAVPPVKKTPQGIELGSTERKVTRRKVSLDAGEYLVVDPNMLPDEFRTVHEYAIIGSIAYPKDFCDDQIACSNVNEGRPVAGNTAFSFFAIEEGAKRLWLHANCYRPTRKWWTATFRDRVIVQDGVKLPWESSNDTDA